VIKDLLKYYFLLCTLLVAACSVQTDKSELQEGDILFQDLDCGDLCDAIEAVTEGVNGRDFSHCAIVVEIKDTLKVIEAIGDAVQINSLVDFYARSGNRTEKIAVGRLKEEYRPLINKASEFSIAQVGAAYDEVYIIYNNSWYCSELIYESFRRANDGQDFFSLEPMTFKNPESEDFFPAWVDYYAELGEEIPEGEPGLNPGSISRSDKIEIIQIKLFE
jgi:uncharacterized protein YycO